VGGDRKAENTRQRRTLGRMPAGHTWGCVGAEWTPGKGFRVFGGVFCIKKEGARHFNQAEGQIQANRREGAMAHGAGDHNIGAVVCQQAGGGQRPGER